MRCPECNKFVSLEFADPEDVELDVSADTGEKKTIPLTVIMNARIHRDCADCGTELKEASLSASETIDGPDENDVCKDGKEHEFEIEETTIDQIEEGGGRYAKSYYGAEIGYVIRCAHDCGFECEGTISDKVAASEMEEMV